MEQKANVSSLPYTFLSSPVFSGEYNDYTDRCLRKFEEGEIPERCLKWLGKKAAVSKVKTRRLKSSLRGICWQIERANTTRLRCEAAQRTQDYVTQCSSGPCRGAINAAMAILLKVFVRGISYLSAYNLETLSQTNLRRTVSSFTLFKLLSMTSCESGHTLSGWG